MTKIYETDADYILDVLVKVEDSLTEEINNNLPENIKIQFAKFLAIRNTIENINVKNAFEKGLFNRAI
ncbi:MAG: hypothetical protein E7206_17610 [Clostridium beijerinckii]|nr:hypothetical protein [Clostridium beijerinckii]